MPLSPAAPREHLHQREIQVSGYLRADGLVDIEGHLTDTKPYDLDTDKRGTLLPGKPLNGVTPLHGMWMRLTIDQKMTIVASEAYTEFGPYAICPGGAESYSLLVGLTLKPGFLRAANERMGGTAGCTHIREMLQQMATTAFQTMWPVRERLAAEARRRRRTEGKPDRETAADPDSDARLLNTCYAYSSEREVVQRRWPQLYTGADAAAAPPQPTVATSREN